ncbi:MAG: TetR family transcriptional regulator [Flavobacterium sp.]|uniref:TetR/AcrR family transcriptional regulator n=1 Tax=unclassified Flavobacterium TaxID=196869 RepID=UPI000C44C0D1|nr:MULTISPECIES: TetR/AcrR family transcriptional regulator [unclassified Flavobacterium]MBF04614.1 TetR family transcriptional regulator [Flavobacterium sp.]MCO6164471.1 TetR/AcrR family transcriptional regulator [Flavobacterium sp. NRK F7]|tara:strand:+ start:2571 stop:3164 length:594 start_codon:yes stop_codon:yes gene_type:complete
MRKPEQTKEKILRESSILFNTKGYKSTSISDITNATGYTKGAIYRHFENKDNLEIQAYEKMVRFIFTNLKTKIREAKNTKDKLFIFLNHFENYIINENFAGGCPLLNVSIEVDDTNCDLKYKAQNTLTVFKETIKTIITNGKTHQQVQLNTNEELVASVIIASLEGGIMMSKLTQSEKDIKNVVIHLKTWIEKDILL